MAQDSPRDRAVDRLLREALGSDSPASACVEPDQLAAWAERTLPSAECASVERHLASCARCRSVVATLARTEPAQVQPRAARWPGWGLGWLVPAAAAAIAVVVLLLVPWDDGSGVAEQSTTLAQADSPAPIAPPPPAPAPTATSTEAAAESSTVEAAPRPAPAIAPAAPAAPAPPAAPRERSTDPAEPLRQEMAAAASGTAPASRPAISAQSGEASPPPVANSPPAPVPGTGPAPGDAQDQATQARGVFESASKALAAPPIPGPAPVAAAPRAPIQFASPDGSVEWRINPDGSVDRRDVPAATWTSVPLADAARATAGSAPSGEVCWIVGRAGAVLVSEDGGSFRRVESPTRDDLVGVDAMSGQEATVTDAAGGRYATSDAGRTWREVR